MLSFLIPKEEYILLFAKHLSTTHNQMYIKMDLNRMLVCNTFFFLSLSFFLEISLTYLDSASRNEAAKCCKADLGNDRAWVQSVVEIFSSVDQKETFIVLTAGM